MIKRVGDEEMSVTIYGDPERIVHTGFQSRSPVSAIIRYPHTSQPIQPTG